MRYFLLVRVIRNGNEDFNSLFPVFLMKFYVSRRLRMQRRRRQLERVWKRVDVVQRRLKKQRMQLLALAFSMCIFPPIEWQFWVSPSRYLSTFHLCIFIIIQIIATVGFVLGFASYSYMTVIILM